MARARQPVNINGITFDALIDESQTLEADIPAYPTEAGFEVSDRIRVGYKGSARVADIFAKYGAQIAADTLAESCEGSLAGHEKEWDINGERVALSVMKWGE